MGMKKWATQGLQRGDLTLLSQIAQGGVAETEESRLTRLKERGFVSSDRGKVRITLSGRTALITRKISGSFG